MEEVDGVEETDEDKEEEMEGRGGEEEGEGEEDWKEEGYQMKRKGNHY